MNRSSPKHPRARLAAALVAGLSLSAMAVSL